MVTKIEKVVLHAALIMLDLPPVGIEIFKIKGITPTDAFDRHDRTNLVFIFQFVNFFVSLPHFLARGDFQSPMIQHRKRALNVLPKLQADDMKFKAKRENHATVGDLHAVESEKFLVEFPRLLEIAAFTGTMRKHKRLNYGIVVPGTLPYVLGPGLVDRLQSPSVSFSYQTAAERFYRIDHFSVQTF